MPWYECPRCGSQETFFQKEQEFNNGVETYTDVHGRTQFRRNLRVSSVNIPYCRECMVVKMNSYLTQEEIERRTRNRILYGIALILVFVVALAWSSSSSNSGSSYSGASEIDSTPSQTRSLYVSDYKDDGSHEIDRELISTGTTDCGGTLGRNIQTIDQLIPQNWQLFEFDGCGSGSSYEWINPNDDLEMIRIEGHADVGWCSELADSDIEAAVKNRILGFDEVMQQFSKVETEEVAHYAYLKTTQDGLNEVIGVIQIGSALEFCGSGDFRIESYLIDSEAELFQTVVRVAFSMS